MRLFIFLAIICTVSLLIFYLAKPDFSRRKIRLMNLYSSLLSDMNLDFKSTDIRATNIGDISKSILNFSSEIEAMSEMATDQNKEDQKWLLNMIVEFNTHLHLWIDRHENELGALEESIDEIKTPDVSQKSTLKLASKRLESHIQVLAKL